MANAYSGTIRKIIESNLPLAGFSDEEKTEVIDFFEDHCIMQIHVNVLDRLSRADRDEFYRINEHRDPNKIKEFLEQKLPDYMDLVQDTTRKMIQEFIRFQMPVNTQG
jgi:hypothetical protein